MPAIFDRINHIAFGVGLTIMAEEVSYLPLSGGVIAARGIFDEAHQSIELRDGGEYSTVHPILTIRLADFSASPVQDDGFTIRGIDYKVTDVQPDGHGGATIELRKS